MALEVRREVNSENLAIGLGLGTFPSFYGRHYFLFLQERVWWMAARLEAALSAVCIPPVWVGWRQDGGRVLNIVAHSSQLNSSLVPPPQPCKTHFILFSGWCLKDGCPVERHPECCFLPRCKRKADWFNPGWNSECAWVDHYRKG